MSNPEKRTTSLWRAERTRYVSKTHCKSASISPEKQKNSLVLDLDETLIKTYLYEPPTHVSSTDYVKVLDTESMCLFYVIPRPGLETFFQELSKHFNIYIYTSSTQSYAQAVCKALKIATYVANLFHRKHCQELSQNVYIKNIFKLNFAKETTIFIDDLLIQTKCQPSNSILIKEFNGDLADRELRRLLPFLVFASQLQDVRPISQAQELYYSEIKKREESAQGFIVKPVEKSSKDDYQTDEGESLTGVLKRSTANPTDSISKKSFCFGGLTSRSNNLVQTDTFTTLDDCQTDKFETCKYFSTASLVFRKTNSDGSPGQMSSRASIYTSLNFSPLKRSNID